MYIHYTALSSSKLKPKVSIARTENISFFNAKYFCLSSLSLFTEATELLDVN